MEGLLCEVSVLLSSRLTIRAADQIFFGGKQVLSDISNAGICGGLKPTPGGVKSVDCRNADSVLSSITNAKNIISSVLSGNFQVQDSAKILAEVQLLKKENAEIKAEISALRELILKLQGCSLTASTSDTTPAPPTKDTAEDDFDLFGSDDEEEDEEKKKIVEERLKAYAEKKSKKAGPIAKSSVILDVKPWDDETDLKEMEALVRAIEMDGLVWGGAKLIPIGYGIQKLQIISVVEDAKVSVDDLIEKITENEDYVQSVDIAAFNKI